MSWRCFSSPSNTYLVSAADPLHLWVTSNNIENGGTTVYSSDDGGSGWRALSLEGCRSGMMSIFSIELGCSSR